MLSIFQKRTYLIDLLDGLTDFHNHILPGIDDGAKTVSESLQLINAFEEIGITKFVATPHVIGEYYPNTPQSIHTALNEVKDELQPHFKIKAAAEYMMDQHFVEIIEKKNILTVSDRNVLVEMSYFQPPLNLNEILFKLQNNSFSPILAHPERYAYLQSRSLEKFRDLKSRGCSFQLNMLSLSGHYGESIKKTAFQLLEEDLLDFICSDVHRIEHIDKIRKIRIPKKYHDQVKELADNNKKLFSTENLNY
ncbi:histidinol phosphatase [Gramella jeungdoensis]|uniref:protein-tyrosine-phosphatase n=1 Tax=Gramella jeungdoensis TaxID=708091 RepID=A0ABT0Z5H0_9FLAO|nr:CpsB/CapC family capsule biosynthesis tyrosine phosphatase [Gramella jeungdoensis]MCM8570465.1 histidinol phosphatase [Gramella jeungdoensis]